MGPILELIPSSIELLMMLLTLDICVALLALGCCMCPNKMAEEIIISVEVIR